MSLPDKHHDAPADRVLELSGISKRFGALLANDAISLDLRRGEVLALLGENGAGKSTLMSILFGHYTADRGYIRAFGAPLPSGDPAAALGAGIGMVHQHFTLADNLSVLDNVMLGTEPLWQPFMRRGAGRRRLLELGRKFGLAVEPEARVGALSMGERQRVEILKALYRGARVLILDEPTAVLTPDESAALFRTLATLTARGLSVIFISHKLDEVLAHSDRVAVLRRGRLVAERRTLHCTRESLAALMVGARTVEPPGDTPIDKVRPAATTDGKPMRETAPTEPAGRTPITGDDAADTPDAAAETVGTSTTATAPPTDAVNMAPEPARETPAAPPTPTDAARATTTDAGAAMAATAPRLRLIALAHGTLRKASLDLAPGEIVGIAGVSGNGQDELAQLLFGLARPSAGSILLDGEPLPASPRALTRLGVGRVPADRAREGLIADLSVAENAVSERLADAPFSRLGWIARGAARALAERLVRDFDVRCAGTNAAARSMSGGNMQKLVLGRALAAGPAPRVLVLHQPTWGLDVGAVAAVHARLRAARDAGAAVLLISDDLDELLTLCDRIAVMFRGRLGRARAGVSRSELGLAMAGAET
ncbi:ABC transporter ATP-binding protein [Derxia gummosa]|uniref:ABC transporter ATP-binding protein n=1 Tax=Derxia gummosa DSM 723 TaxID=1121388 RepID=A0A8B6X943_9BURK|nr:ABC transporter ATP-binding protein [Derxia gummosa]